MRVRVTIIYRSAVKLISGQRFVFMNFWRCSFDSAPQYA